MTYQQPTAWVGDYSVAHPDRQKRRSAARHGDTLPGRFPRVYPFPIDFLCDERLLALLGVLVREAGLTEAQARVAAALVAGYTTNRMIADRLTISPLTVRRVLNALYRRFGITASVPATGLRRAQLATRLWPYYAPLRPRILLLPRLDPALIALEPRHDRIAQAAD